MKLLSIILLFLFAFKSSTAQNLFANPGFEDINICREYHMPCSPSAWFNFNPVANPMVKGFMVPTPLLGTNMLLVPVANVIDSAERPMLYTMFLCPLVKGEEYKLSFYINTAKRKFYHLDFFFSEKEPASKSFDVAGIKPSVIAAPENIVANMRLGWEYTELVYTAKGGEKFCTIGNLSDRMNYKLKDKMNETGRIYYFLDGIKMQGAAGNICPEYEHNRKMLYDQNSRHNENELVEKEAEKPRLPPFKADTLIIPMAFFETNSDKLKPGFTNLADSMLVLIAAKKPAKIDILGFTDSIGSADKNQTLSEKRASAVLSYIVKKLPYMADHIFGAGKGEEFPRAGNDTEKGRYLNRRVEIILTYVARPE